MTTLRTDAKSCVSPIRIFCTDAKSCVFPAQPVPAQNITLTVYEYIAGDEIEHHLEAAPCPFCGSTDLELDDTNPYAIRVRCLECDAAGPARDEYTTAVNHWNHADPCIGIPQS